MTKIYSLWLQGYNNAPDQIKTCLNRWSILNPTYEFELLDESDVRSLLEIYPLEIDNITQQSLSDITRLALLKKTGGIWVDATVFPTKPLSEWLEETVGESEFFSYRRETEQGALTDRPISAWFLYSKEGSKIIERLWQETIRYWSVKHRPISDLEKDRYQEDPIAFMGLSQEVSNPPYPYHWFQHIFAYLVKNDLSFAKTWNSCSHESITGPHEMQFWLREELMNKNSTSCLTEERIRDIVEKSAMQKLDWRMEFPIETMEKYSEMTPPSIFMSSLLDRNFHEPKKK
jgi:hypothetical protein